MWMLLAVLFIIKLGSIQTIKWVSECINCGIGNGILFSAENNRLLRLKKTSRNLKYILLNERSQSEKATYCKLRKQGKGQKLPEATGRERWLGGAQRIFKAGTLLCMKVQWWIQVTIPLSQLREYTSWRVSPKGTLWTLGDDDMSVWVHQHNKCITLVHDFNSGKLCSYRGRE